MCMLDYTRRPAGRPAGTLRAASACTHPPGAPPTLCADSSFWNSMNANRMLPCGSPHTRQSATTPQSRKNSASCISPVCTQMKCNETSIQTVSQCASSMIQGRARVKEGRAAAAHCALG